MLAPHLLKTYFGLVSSNDNITIKIDKKKIELWILPDQIVKVLHLTKGSGCKYLGIRRIKDWGKCLIPLQSLFDVFFYSKVFFI